MLTGWNRINDNPYYFHDNGQMAQGLQHLAKIHTTLMTKVYWLLDGMRLTIAGTMRMELA